MNALIAAFFAKAILSRWWSQYVRLPSPDTLSLQLHGLVMLEGEKEGLALQFCHSVMRYLLLSYVLAVRRVSSVVQDIFPTSQVSQRLKLRFGKISQVRKRPLTRAFSWLKVPRLLALVGAFSMLVKSS